MSVWFKKYFGKKNHTPTFDLFEKHFMGLAGPKDMMMIEGGDLLDYTIFIRLPDDKLSSVYKGFERASLRDIPKDFKFLIGHQDQRDALKALLDKG